MEQYRGVVIGLDIGGTKITACGMDRAGRIAAERTVPTLAQERKVMEQAYRAVDGVLAALRDEGIGKASIQGIGVGSAGQIDFEAGVVRSATDLLPDYGGTPIRALLEARYGLPAFVDNDVNVLALAEKVFGAGAEVRHMVCVALGTGIGGAIVSEGKLLHGKHGGAGELGHCSVNYRGPRCNCGNYGCIELYASGTGMLRLWKELAADVGSGEVPEPADARDIFRRSEAGDPVGKRVIGEMLDALSAALASWIHSFHPERIVLGGGVADSLHPYLQDIIEKTRQRTIPSMFGDVRIECTAMGGKAGVMGAAAQVWEYAGGRG